MTHAACFLDAIHTAPADRPFVVAQLGQSLDGRIATVTGHSRWISGEAALDHLHALRAAVDAVVVGVGTVLADDPQLTVRRVAGRHPARVVIDPRGRMPQGMRCAGADGIACYCVTPNPARVPEGLIAVEVPDGEGGMAPGDIVAALFRLGLRRLLIEGGANTISRFIDAGAVDRLHVLLAPVILGSGRAGLDLAPIATVGEALRPRTRVGVLADGNVLFDCDLRS